MKKRASRPDENEGRRKGFLAARMIMTDPTLTMIEAAKMCGATRCTSHEALLVLRHGTEAEIASVENHEIGLGALVAVIRARTPRSERQRKPPVRGVEIRQSFAVDAAIWEKLRNALDGIASLPQPSDVVTIVRGNTRRTKAVNRTLIAAFGWLTEFSDAWTK